ncbi:MAG: type IV pilus biogenesis/stability protein PilW [Eikenella sp.]|nr:type IV pilus biogenesis/stability protein PilW [Eikenella sp.]
MKKLLGAALITASLLSGCAGITIHTGQKEERNRPEEVAAIKIQLAIEYMNAGSYRDAVAAIEEALTLQPRNENAWLVRAAIYQFLKVPDKTQESFQRALALKPDSAEINNNYGWFLCNGGNRPNEAMAYFDRALADPTYPSPQIAYMNKGICSARLGQYNLATSYLQRALSTAPDFVPPQKELARVAFLEGKTGEADRQFRQYQSKVNVLGPDDLLLGWKIARAMGQTQAAYEYEAQLRTHHPYSPELQEITTGKVQ